MYKYYLGFFAFLGFLFSNSAASYVYTIHNDLDKSVTVRLKYKEFFGTCAKDDIFKLSAKQQNQRNAVQGICCVTHITAIPEGEPETTVFGSDLGTHCFDFSIRVGRAANGSIKIDR